MLELELSQSTLVVAVISLDVARKEVDSGNSRRQLGVGQVAEGLQDLSAPVLHLHGAQLGIPAQWAPQKCPGIQGCPCIRGRKELLSVFLQLVQISGWLWREHLLYQTCRTRCCAEELIPGAPPGVSLPACSPEGSFQLFSVENWGISQLASFMCF